MSPDTHTFINDVIALVAGGALGAAIMMLFVFIHELFRK